MIFLLVVFLLGHVVVFIQLVPEATDVKWFDESMDNIAILIGALFVQGRLYGDLCRHISGPVGGHGTGRTAILTNGAIPALLAEGITFFIIVVMDEFDTPLGGIKFHLIEDLGAQGISDGGKLGLTATSTDRAMDDVTRQQFDMDGNGHSSFTDGNCEGNVTPLGLRVNKSSIC